jgi:hypothetical protein
MSEPRELSRAAFGKLVEARLMSSLGMSVADLSDALASGRIDPESPGVAQFAILIARPS